MAKVFSFTILTFFIIIGNIFFYCAFANDKKVYIAYMGTLPKRVDYSPSDNHKNILQEVLENSSLTDSLIWSYKRSFNGFAAMLNEKERQKLASKEGVISVFPSRNYELHTTRSWDFIGLKENSKRVPKLESDVIVGVIDSGIWPESDSFSDEGFGPTPKKWKGDCKGGQNFTCNKKIIGARFYVSANARDEKGHGSHTSSTLAGNQVNNVSFYGIAQGNARGAVPSARIAVYKVCDPLGCQEANVLAAFDDAISDGVDIISISLGATVPREYLEDSISIGSFHAMQNGILTSQSAGNSGPLQQSIGGITPWAISVAASTIDRKIINKVVLGDNTTLLGNAINAFETTNALPLFKCKVIRKGQTTCNTPISRLDNKNRLKSNLREGKILIYDDMETGEDALFDKAAGMILRTDSFLDSAHTYPLPTSLFDLFDAGIVDLYTEKSRKPVARIWKSEASKDLNAPVVASFSSRGPNSITPQILKPDITAPGVEILAAWSPHSSPSIYLRDKRSVMYNIISGTSIACPHVTGAAAYVKSFHPNWSPSTVKSALMTTASPLNVTKNPDAEFGYGAGHINPIKAINPGLVYDANEDDYVKFLCNFYSSVEIRSLTGDDNTTCPSVPILAKDLNYPSLATISHEENFTRTVTNVGMANSIYTATVVAPPIMKIKVVPETLSFRSLNQKKSFVVSVSVTKKTDHPVNSASLIWSDGIHSVRSPIVFMNLQVYS